MWTRESRGEIGRGGGECDQHSNLQRTLIWTSQRFDPYTDYNWSHHCTMGPPGVGKTIFCQSLLREAARLGLTCLYAVTNSPLQVVRDQLRVQGVPPQERPDQIIYVDMYSWLVGERSTERFQIDNAMDMAGMSVVLSSAAETVGVKADFDSVIEMKLEEADGELRRAVRVYSYRGGHQTRWFRFLITPEKTVRIY